MNKYLIQLMLSKGIGDVSIKKILNYTFSNPNCTLKDLCLAPDKLINIIRCNENTINSVISNSNKAQKLYDDICKQGIQIITEKDKDYPQKLIDTLGPSCPPVLFLHGNIALLSSLSVGFCGSRKASNKGLEITSQCADILVKNGISVVSGYASGVDMAAHSSALHNSGNTIFVLAEGILKYTRKKTIENLLSEKNHLFLSQFLPDSNWNVGNAMKRNSLIIGLSEVMILVESGNSGGTFAAGNESLKRGTPLFVIDYANPEVSAEANPYFIKNGGLPIRGKNNIPNLDKVIYLTKNYKKVKCRDNFIAEQLSL